MNAAVGHMDGSALMVIGVSAWYPDIIEALQIENFSDEGILKRTKVDINQFRVDKLERLDVSLNPE